MRNLTLILLTFGKTEIYTKLQDITCRNQKMTNILIYAIAFCHSSNIRNFQRQNLAELK